MDNIRIVQEHEACGLAVDGFNEGEIKWSGTPSSEDIALSAALISEHIEDTDTYVKATLATACPTVHTLASGQQWSDYIAQQHAVRKRHVQKVYGNVDLNYLFHRHKWADKTNDPNKGDIEDDYYDPLLAVMAEYPEEEE